MHVRVRVIRDVVVDHVRHVRDVEAPRGDVGRNEQGDLVGTELAQHALALRLAHIAVNGVCAVPACLQRRREIRRLASRAAEDNRRVRLLHVENVGERVALAARLGLVVDLVGQRHFLRFVRKGDGLRIVHVAARERLNARRYGRRKQRHLPPLGRLIKDQLNIVDEAHVQHLVGLIQHDDADRIELQRAAPDVIHHATGRTHDEMRAGPQAAQLVLIRLAAVHRQHVDAAVPPYRVRRLSHLHGQFARGREHERLHDAFRGIDEFHDRNRECGCLAGARRGLRNDVGAAHQRRNRLLLNRRRLFKPERLDRLHDLRLQAQCVEQRLHERTSSARCWDAP